MKILNTLQHRFEIIIKLCDNPAYTKSDIRQVANEACSFIYLEIFNEKKKIQKDTKRLD